jgi:exopolyphosphatase/guanosine-5'-triphosphate,3'-diphosphate pyrophosphatase
MLKASIDLGTNTCLLLVADWDAGRREVVRVLHDQSTMVRLGQGVDRSKRLHPDAIARTRACLRGYAAKMAALGVKPSDAICVATATARDAENGAEFFDQVASETGLRFRTISGDEEARFMFAGGLLPGMDRGRSSVIDIGGGSTELRSEKSGASLQMGSVRFTERFLRSDPVTDPEFWACQEEIDRLLETQAGWRDSIAKDAELVGVAGTVVSLAQWQLGLAAFDSSAIDGTELTRGDVHRMVEELKWRTAAERAELPGIEKGRADVILAGALILWRAMEVLGFPKLRVSTRGLRYGALELEARA